MISGTVTAHAYIIYHRISICKIANGTAIKGPLLQHIEASRLVDVFVFEVGARVVDLEDMNLFHDQYTIFGGPGNRHFLTSMFSLRFRLPRFKKFYHSQSSLLDDLSQRGFIQDITR
jgi:hypothetical protein